MTAPCPRGPHGPTFPSRTRAKAARLQSVLAGDVRVTECGLCGGIHLAPNLTSRNRETWT